jgi:hypothetical protein
MKLSILKLLAPNKSHLGKLVFTASFGLVLGISGLANVSALEPNLDETSDFVTNKVAIGEPNAEAAPDADSIRTCGPAPADKDHSRYGRYFRVNSVNMRRLPSTSATICAQGQKSHLVDYHCYKTGRDGHTWSFVHDVTTNYAGWVRDNLLVGNGSLVHC